MPFSSRPLLSIALLGLLLCAVIPTFTFADNKLGYNPNKPYLPFMYSLGGVNCEDEIRGANRTINEFANWRDTMEAMRLNYTEQLPGCKDSVKGTDIADYFDYELDFANCPGARANWVIVAVVFIVAFLLALGGLITVSVLYYREYSRNHQ